MVARVLWVSDPKTIEYRFGERWSQSKENWKQIPLRAIRLCDASGRTKHTEGKNELKNLIILTGCGAVGSARALGARCRRFKSCHSDQNRGFARNQSRRGNSAVFHFRKERIG